MVDGWKGRRGASGLKLYSEHAEPFMFFKKFGVKGVLTSRDGSV